MQVAMDEVESQFPRLGELAWQGEDVVITKDGAPYLTLAPYHDNGRDNGRDDELAERLADASDLVIGPEIMREIETEGSVSWEEFKRELGLEDID